MNVADRRWIYAALVLWLTPVLAVGAGGLPLTRGPATTAGLTAALLIAAPASRRLALALGAARPLPALFWIALVAAAASAILQIASVSVFMADVGRQEFSVQPEDRFRRVHSCASAYAEAARLLNEGGHNIYERDLYRPGGKPRQIGPLNVDPFHYPPPFLLLPQAVRVIAPEFWDFRRLWFTLQALVLAGAVVGLAAWVGGRPGARALLGGVFLLALPETAATLQQGNFQVTAISIAVVGFVLLMSGRLVPGGGLLAYAALAKIFPGILVIPLVAARRWRAVTCIAGMGLAIAALTLALQGVRPLRDFVSTSLPELSTGAAFPQTEMPTNSNVNWSAYGQTVRLRQLGVSWLTRPRGLMVAELYGLLVVGLAAWAGWKRRFDAASAAGRIAIVQVALALLSLASFRSPFVGALYGVVATLWVLTLLAAGASSTARAVLWLGVLAALGAGVWLLPSPAVVPSDTWIWISGLLVFACMTINVWALTAAVRMTAPPPALAPYPAAAAAGAP